jgi:hypothetical protein
MVLVLILSPIYQNLFFSLTKVIFTKGAEMSSKGQIINLNIWENGIFFNKIFQHGSDLLLGIEIHPNTSHKAVTA